LKVYSEKIDHMDKWENEDKAYYLNSIEKILESFFELKGEL